MNSNSSSVSVFRSAEKNLLVTSFLRKRRADREQRAEKDPDNKVLTLFVTRFPAKRRSRPGDEVHLEPKWSNNSQMILCVGALRFKGKYGEGEAHGMNERSTGR